MYAISLSINKQNNEQILVKSVCLKGTWFQKYTMMVHWLYAHQEHSTEHFMFTDTTCVFITGESECTDLMASAVKNDSILLKVE